MPELNIDELERLAAQATPGPWEVDDCNNIRIAPKGRPLVATIHDDEDYLPRMADAQYIVAACNAVPELISMYRKADDEAYEANEAWKKLRVEYITLHDRVQKLEKEKNSLEFALKSVLCDLIELNPAYCGPCHGCKDGKKNTPLLCQAAMLEAYKEEAGEEEC